jgi:hypothetical protein
MIYGYQVDLLHGNLGNLFEMVGDVVHVEAPYDAHCEDNECHILFNIF